jgi:hypothetical protein
MSINHYVKSFEEFLAEDLDLTRTIPFDHTDDDDELDDTDSPDLPEDLKDENRKRHLKRILVDPELEDENEEGEP